MRSIADYTERILEDRQLPPGVLIANAHRRAAERGSTRPGADATVTRVVDDLIATGDFDELLVGAVDPAAWAVREALRDRATQRLSELAVHPGGETSALIADHLALEIDARYPALSDDFQRVLERFERDWGYRRSYATDLALPGVRARSSAVWALQREPGWPAARVNGGAPSTLGTRADSRSHRLPDHISVIRYQRFPVVELSIWPQDDGPDAVWMQVGLAMQDGVRLIPFDTSQAGPDVLDAELLAPLAEVAAAAYAWHDVLAARHRSVYTARYQRDGLPAPAWRALPG